MSDHETPWAMQIAVHYDKVHPARQVDVVEAAARAVVQLLAAPQAAPGGPWARAVDYWRDGRIRKLVRRARGARWREVQELDGITVTQDGPTGWGPAQARAFVPAPVRPLPPALAKTQVEGTHFPLGDEPAPPPAALAATLAQGTSQEDLIVLGTHSLSDSAVVTIEATPLHEMTSGKLAAQCAHAAQLAWESPLMPPRVRQAWKEDGYRVCVVLPTVAQWQAATRPVTVTDAGYTELDGPTQTARAYWRG